MQHKNDKIRTIYMNKRDVLDFLPAYFFLWACGSWIQQGYDHRLYTGVVHWKLIILNLSQHNFLCTNLTNSIGPCLNYHISISAVWVHVVKNKICISLRPNKMTTLNRIQEFHIKSLCIYMYTNHLLLIIFTYIYEKVHASLSSANKSYVV